MPSSKNALRDLSPALAIVSLLLMSQSAHADGSSIDKIYHPYVDALENEIEYRSISQDRIDGQDTPREIHRLAFGRSIGESMFGEVYLIGAKSRSDTFDLEAYEFELKWQLTEQGEFWADWGMLVELEKEIDEDIQEFAVGVFTEKEFGRWSGTTNLFLIREWGDDIDNEYETALSLQARYRYSRAFEPALELYAGDDVKGIGPTFMGNINLGVRRSLNWEAGVIFGADSESPDQTFRLLVEFEF
jgi:hypothetical protein|tara:strand:+ start:295 stop:1029 length:735 start_codon:yes stop_codon:yes gene_type:complete